VRTQHGAPAPPVQAAPAAALAAEQVVFLQSEINLHSNDDVRKYELLGYLADGRAEVQSVATGGRKTVAPADVLPYAPPPPIFPHTLAGATAAYHTYQAPLQSLQRSGLPFPLVCPVVPTDGSSPAGYNFVPRADFLSQQQAEWDAISKKEDYSGRRYPVRPQQ